MRGSWRWPGVCPASGMLAACGRAEVETMRNQFGAISLRELNNEIDYVRNADGSFSGATQRRQGQSDMIIDPVAQSYRVGGDTLLPANRVAAESDGRFTTNGISGGGSTRTYRVHSPAATNDQLVLSSVGLALEDIANSDNSRVDRAFVLGIAALPDDIPRIGTGVYRSVLHGSAVGSGSAADHFALTGTTILSVDFGGSSFTGSMMPVATSQRTGIATALGDCTFLNGDIGGVAGATGRLAGRCYGPRAEAVGGSFSLTTPGAGTTLIGAGVIAAKR